MRGRSFGIMALCSLLGICVAPPLSAQSEEVQRVVNSIAVFHAISGITEKEVPALMMKHAQGIAIFPRVRRAGFVVGLQEGHGLLVTRAEDGKWGNPLFLTLSGGSIGWQVGIQSVDLVLFFQTRRSVDRMLRGQFTLGVDASIAAGSTGRQAGANTDADLESEIYSYSRTRGFFAGLSLSGASLAVDYDANDAYYGKNDLRSKDILSGRSLSSPQASDELKKSLEEYARSVRE
jgi:lipid-binding SYLF domain-containing protein